MRQAVIYARYSPRPGVSESCDAQIAQARAWCERSDLEVVGVHRDDGVSGAKRHRTGLEAAIADVCRARGVLVVYSLSRLARSTMHAIEISERLSAGGADLASLRESIDTQSPMGRFFFTVMSAIAQLEREQIAGRTQDAMLAYQARGRRMSATLPYGWASDPSDPARMVRDPDEQQAIALICRLTSKGLGQRAICRELHARGIACRGRARWNPGTIRSVLRRAGVSRAGGRERSAAQRTTEPAPPCQV